MDEAPHAKVSPRSSPIWPLPVSLTDYLPRLSTLLAHKISTLEVNFETIDLCLRNNTKAVGASLALNVSVASQIYIRACTLLHPDASYRQRKGQRSIRPRSTGTWRLCRQERDRISPDPRCRRMPLDQRQYLTAIVPCSAQKPSSLFLRLIDRVNVHGFSLSNLPSLPHLSLHRPLARSQASMQR
jgi:hypothetical protein